MMTTYYWAILAYRSNRNARRMIEADALAELDREIELAGARGWIVLERGVSG